MPARAMLNAQLSGSGRSFTLADIVRDPSLLAGVDQARIVALLTEMAAIQTRLAARLAEVGCVASASDCALATGRLLDARKVASALDIRPHAVYELHRAGKLPGVRIGKRRLRFREQDVLALRGSTGEDH